MEIRLPIVLKARITRRHVGILASVVTIATVGIISGGQFINGHGGVTTQSTATTPPPPPAGQANLWIDQNGGTCARSASARVYTGAGDTASCATFQAAYTAAACGDVVGVVGGTYASQSISSNSKSCTSSTPVKITSVPGGVCTDNTTVGMPSVSLSVSYAFIQCMNANTGGPNVDNCSGIGGASGQHANIIWDTYDYMALECGFYDSDHMRITNSSFGPVNVCNEGLEDMIDFRSNASTILDVVFDHDFFGSVTAPPDFQCGIGQHVDSMQGYGIALTVSNSVFTGCPGQCIIFRPFGGGIPGPLTFVNNVFNNCQSCGQAIDLGDSANSNTCGTGCGIDTANCPILVQNNTFVNGAAIHGGFNNCAPTIRNNIFPSSGSCNFGSAGTNIGATYSFNVFGSGSCGTNAKICTPAYVGASSNLITLGNFNLAPTDTCAVGAADQTSGNYPATDINGNPRPQAGAVDAGAYEIPTGYQFTKMLEADDTDRTSHTFTFTGSAPVGSTVVACTTYSVDGENTVGMTDSKGNTWNMVYEQDQTDPSANFAQDFYYTTVTHAIVPGDTVTMPVNPATLPIGNTLWTEFWAVQAPGRTLVLDKNAHGNTGFNTSHSSPSVTTTSGDEVMFGCHSAQSISGAWWSPGVGWTLLGIWNTNNGQVRDTAIQQRTVNAIGTYASTGTTGGSNYTVDSIVTFK